MNTGANVLMTLSTVAAAILPVCAIAWPDATCNVLAVTLAIAWRLRRRAKETQPCREE